MAQRADVSCAGRRRMSLPASVTAMDSRPATLALNGPAALAGLEIDPGLGALFGYIAARTRAIHGYLDSVLRTPRGQVFAAATDGKLVGYLLIAPVDTVLPWGRLRDQRILDVSFEVARGWRGKGLAVALFQRAFEQPDVESRIYVARAYASCWDLADNDVGLYAERLLKLFERFGFRRERTNAPSIALEPFNFLVVRIGQLVPADRIARFRLSLTEPKAA